MLDFVNVGGGLPGRYKNFRARVYDDIFAKLKDFKNWLSQFNAKMIIEPGRFIASPSVKLEANIKNIYDS